jgi:hypothetical protein
MLRKANAIVFKKSLLSGQCDWLHLNSIPPLHISFFMFMGRDWETISPLCCMACEEDMSEKSKTKRSTIHPSIGCPL